MYVVNFLEDSQTHLLANRGAIDHTSFNMWFIYYWYFLCGQMEVNFWEMKIKHVNSLINRLSRMSDAD
jgi:hypothetical protein